jgi:hypothetical protein
MCYWLVKYSNTSSEGPLSKVLYLPSYFLELSILGHNIVSAYGSTSLGKSKGYGLEG